MPQPTDIYSDRPRPIASGAPLEYKVKVQHRSDILMREQMENVRNIQDALNTALLELEESRSGEETHFLHNQVKDLHAKTEEMMLVLKVVHKLNSELVFARMELQKALRSGMGSVNVARKRVGWLEDRMERVLGKSHRKSPDRGGLQSAAMEDPRFLLDGRDDSMSHGRGYDKVLDSDNSEALSDMMDGRQMRIVDSPQSSVVEAHKMSPQMPAQLEHSLAGLPLALERMKNMQDAETSSSEDTISVKCVRRKNPTELDGDMYSSSSVTVSPMATHHCDTETSDSLAHSEALPVVEEQTTAKKSKGSRVQVRSPEEEPCVEATSPVVDEPLTYWDSEHHRFEMGEFASKLCQINPLSYHQMGLAVPGTFVDEVGQEVPLPWRRDRKGTSNSDIHKMALDKLSSRLHKIYGKIREAAMLSVYSKVPDSSVALRMALNSTSGDVLAKPSMSRVLDKGSQECLTFPALDKDRLGSSMSGRLVYYPKPLPYPEKLPITQTDRCKVFPCDTANFSLSTPGKADPATRIVNQHNLLKETTFTSSLFRAKTLATGDGLSRKAFGMDGLEPSSHESEKKTRPTMKSTIDVIRGAVKFTAAGKTKWNIMKPKGGAIDHSGLKWERVKSIVHNSLVSPCVNERIDGARHLGLLNCLDTMVMYALKERLKHDEEDRVKYEATKSLVMLGCWEEEVLSSIVRFLIDGNRAVRSDILHTMSHGKNVQYVDKKHYSFPELAKILSLLCLSDDPEDAISLDAAVCLGKLCVADANAKNKLLQIIQHSKDTHIKAEAIEILVRQLNYRELDIVDAVLNHVTQSPSWKNRRAAVKLLVYLGKRLVCGDNDETERVYSILENRLWDDPNKTVRQESARALAALDMFARACERAEKRLEDAAEEVRAQAVITLGTLNVKNERIIRSLVEMLELDSSEYVRLVIIRTFAVLNSQDKRILRALKDKEKGDGPLSRAAKKTLESIGVTSGNSSGNNKISNAVGAPTITINVK